MSATAGGGITSAPAAPAFHLEIVNNTPVKPKVEDNSVGPGGVCQFRVTIGQIIAEDLGGGGPVAQTGRDIFGWGRIPLTR